MNISVHTPAVCLLKDVWIIFPRNTVYYKILKVSVLAFINLFKLLF